MSVSDTPRTDEAELDDAHFSDWGSGASGYCPAEFARTLERELTQAMNSFSDGAKWVPASEPPPVDRVVLVWETGTSHPFNVAVYKGKPTRLRETAWVDLTGEWIDVTHWMPLPEAPKC